MARGIAAALLTVLLAACTVNVNIYDYRASSSKPSVTVPAPTPAARYSELYFASSPALATIRIVSDGSSNLVDRELGSTPLTVRLAPGVSEPFDSGICGKVVIVLFELPGHRTEKVAQKVSCFTSESAAEKSANEFRATLNPHP